METPIKSNKVTLTSGYGNRKYRYQGKLVRDFHNGNDLVPSPYYACDILAFEDGTVTGVQKTGVQYGTGCYVRIKHDNGYYTLYHHLKTNSICVNVGDRVKKGQKLGIIGTTGQSTGVHLHFQIDKGSSSTSINPYDYLFNGKKLVEDKPIDELANEVIQGLWGNGEDRKDRLTKAGYNYNEVQARVNEILNSSKNNDELLDLVRRTIRGDFGNGTERKNRLGSRYSEVQEQVNKNIENNNWTWDNIKLY